MSRSRQRRPGGPSSPVPRREDRAGDAAAGAPEGSGPASPSDAADEAAPTEGSAGAAGSGVAWPSRNDAPAVDQRREAELARDHRAETVGAASSAYETPPGMPPTARRSSWPAMLASGIVGGGIVAAATYYLLLAIPRQDPAVTSRLAAIETSTGQAATAAGRLDATLEAQAQRLRTIEETQAQRLRAIETLLAEQAQTLGLRIGGVERQLAEQAQALSQRLLAVEQRRPESAPSPEVLQRLSALESRLAGAADLPRSLGQMEARVAALSEDVGRLGQSVNGQQAAVANAVTQLGTERQQLAARVAAVEAGIAGLPTALGDLQTRGVALTQQMERLGEAVAAERQGLEGLAQRVAQAVDTLGNRLTALETTVAGLPKAQPDLAPVMQELARLGAELGRLRDETTAARQEAGAVRADLGGRIDALAKRVDELALASERGPAIALALGDADRALSEGTAIAPVLDRLQGLTGNDPALAEAVKNLAEATAGGVPTTAELERRLAELGPARPAAEPAPAPQGLLGTVTRNLTGLVEVAPADQALEQRRQAVAQAREALRAGDPAKARDLLLPYADAGGEPWRAWLQAAERRLAAERATARLRERLNAMLTAAG